MYAHTVATQETSYAYWWKEGYTVQKWEERWFSLNSVVCVYLVRRRQHNVLVCGDKTVFKYDEPRWATWLHAAAALGLPTPADEIPGDFVKSLEIPGVSRFLRYKRPSKTCYLFYCLVFALFIDHWSMKNLINWSDETQPLDDVTFHSG